MPLTPGSILEGKYRIESLVGSGGMGSVYQATHLSLERPVAVKVLRGDVGAGAASARFRREALAIARLNHPHVITIYDFGFDEEGQAFLVMELLDGRSLGDEILFRRRIPAAEAVALMRQVCAGVHAAHLEGVIHRDIKPDNIFLERSGGGAALAKVLDFGIAKLVGSDAGSESTTTRHGVVLGSPHYLSPERCNGRPADARSDVYSLGCVLYEMLTGRPPFRAKSAPAVMLKHVRQQPDPPGRDAEGVSDALERIVLRALAKDPSDRYQTAEELADALAGAADAPAASAGAAGPVRRVPGNLPSPVTRFVGRGREVADLLESVSRNQLVTLWGPGGVGKTRLALQVAAEAADEFPDGAWIAELAAVSDGSLLADAVAGAVGARGEPGRPAAEALRAWARSRHVLLVLDGCEHLVDACAALAGDLIRACPGLRIMATSREALDVAGETTFAVPALGLPEDVRAGTAADPEAARDCEAVQLFADRAMLAAPDFRLTAENAPAVAELCRRLDGIPLAIELAAARVKVLSVDQLLAKMGDRFRLLTAGSRPASPRQQTLRAAVDWGYSLLCGAEQALLRRLSVFPAGCSLEAAGEIGAGGPVDAARTLDLVTGLVNRSFLIADRSGAEARYRMLETIREYAADRLRESGDEGQAVAALVAWARRLVRTADMAIGGEEGPRWLARLELEHDNVRAALRHARALEDPVPLLELCATLGRFWAVHGHLEEGGAWLAQAAGVGAKAPLPLRAKALHWAGCLASARGELERAANYLRDAHELYAEAGDRPGAARTGLRLGEAAQYSGELERAEVLYQGALEAFRDVGDGSGAALAVAALGALATERGDHRRASELLGESLARFRETGGRISISRNLHNLATARHRLGEYDAAAAHAAESLRLALELGDQGLAACAHRVLGDVARDRGELDAARAHYVDALLAARPLGDTRLVASLLESAAALASRAGDAVLAMRLVGAASAIREATRARLATHERLALDRGIAPARSQLGTGAQTAFASGRALAPVEAVDLAVAGLSPGGRSDARLTAEG